MPSNGKPTDSRLHTAQETSHEKAPPKRGQREGRTLPQPATPPNPATAHSAGAAHPQALLLHTQRLVTPQRRSQQTKLQLQLLPPGLQLHTLTLR